MWPLIGFFLAVVCITGLVTLGVGRLLRPRLPWIGPPLLLMWALGLAFLFPMPIHGGFMLSGELYLDALGEWREERARLRKVRDRLQYEKSLRDETRFANPISFRVLDGVAPWFRVATELGEVAHLHAPSGLVFTDPYLWHPKGRVTWQQADATCRDLPPGNAWSLPNQAELYLFWHDQGGRVSPWGKGRFVSVLHDADLGVSTTVRHLGPGAEMLRCVSRDPAAIGAHFSRTKISLQEWNRFQLDPDRYRR